MVVVSSCEPETSEAYFHLLVSHGWAGEIRFLDHDPSRQPALPASGGVVLTDGPDLDPRTYGGSPRPVLGSQVSHDWDAFQLDLLRYALDRDMPVLAICRGMQLLNVSFGGKLLQDIPGHLPGHLEDAGDGDPVPFRHSIYLSPGSKLAAILGMGGFFRVNSLHRDGLKEAQRSPRLLASAYSLEDGIIEGLESPEHQWVVGVQCRPDREAEVPAIFSNLFVAFLERAEGYAGPT